MILLSGLGCATPVVCIGRRLTARVLYRRFARKVGMLLDQQYLPPNHLACSIIRQWCSKGAFADTVQHMLLQLCFNNDGM